MNSKSSNAAVAAATPAAAQAPEATPVVDPFANVPTVKLNEADNVKDLTDYETSGARKYSKVHAAAIETRMPVMAGWKHERAVFTPGTNRKELRAGSVHGNVQAIVNAAGRSGINAYELVAELRIRSVGNKRSHFCEKLPPVGWAEGWINSAVTRGIIGVSATKQAPALRAEQKAAKDTESTPEQDNAAKNATK